MSWFDKTPEERRAITAKSIATRQRNAARLKEEAHTARVNALGRIDELQAEIGRLEEILEERHRLHQFDMLHGALMQKSMATTEEIVAASAPHSVRCGVYFLVKDEKVIYVGQSVNVASRITAHGWMGFDRVAFIPCEPHQLNMLESLYIHALRPTNNGDLPGGAKMAPMSFEEILACAPYETKTKVLGSRTKTEQS